MLFNRSLACGKHLRAVATWYFKLLKGLSLYSFFFTFPFKVNATIINHTS